ncbi:MAG: ATP-binding cassette domain-containing protein [Thermoanaerobaculia bacterium]
MADDLLTPVLSIHDLTVRAPRSGATILRKVSFDIPRRMVTAIIGPSGAGKSTLLKCLNRLVDLGRDLDVSGRVVFEGTETRSPSVDPDELRRRIGIVFQQPVVFPGSIERNVLFAAHRLGLVNRRNRDEVLESTLSLAGLWSEVRERLAQPASTLSVGQQQRLAIARTLAVDPEVILMDEPTSALDPRSAAAIEEAIVELKKTRTVVLVTHQLDQAKRLADWVACLCPCDGAGELMEADRCSIVFTNPSREETQEFLGLRCDC